MALVGGELFVANADSLVAFPFNPGQTTAIAAAPVTALPSGHNHHWTKILVAVAGRLALFVGVGSNSNVGENGLPRRRTAPPIW